MHSIALQKLHCTTEWMETRDKDPRRPPGPPPNMQPAPKPAAKAPKRAAPESDELPEQHDPVHGEPDYWVPPAGADTLAVPTAVATPTAAVAGGGSPADVDATAPVTLAPEPSAPELLAPDQGRQIITGQMNRYTDRVWGAEFKGLSVRCHATGTCLSLEVYAIESFKNMHLAFEKVAELLNARVIRLMFLETQTSKLCEATNKRSKVRVRQHPKDLTGAQVRGQIEDAMTTTSDSLSTEFGIQYARDVHQLKDFKDQRAIAEGNITQAEEQAQRSKVRNIETLLNTGGAKRTSIVAGDVEGDSQFDLASASDEDDAGSPAAGGTKPAAGGNEVATGVTKPKSGSKKGSTRASPKPASSGTVAQSQKNLLDAQTSNLIERALTEGVDRAVKVADADARRQLANEDAAHRREMDKREMALQEARSLRDDAASQTNMLMMKLLTRHAAAGTD